MKSIDILMATYNGGSYVREQIESIQAQTVADWRLLVSDDCSTDGTLDVVRGLASLDHRIQVVSAGVRYGSAKANFVNLLGISVAQYVMFCDQDDVWLPNKVELTLWEMRELEATVGPDKPLMVFTDMKVVDNGLNIIHESFERYSEIDPMRSKFNQLLAQSIGAGCTMMVNRKAVELALRAKDAEAMIMHDWWLSLICSAFGSIAFIDQPTSLYRQHDGNEIGAKRFSVFSWVGKMDEMVRRQSAISKQAGVFAATYGDVLGAKNLQVARQCAAVCSGNSVSNLANLIRSGTWKSGLRKLGQLLAILRIGR